MQSTDKETVSMQWQVTFRQQQKNCCPPGKYWIVRNEVVEAESAESAEQQVVNSWRYNHSIEIKNVLRIDDEQGK